MDSPRARPIGVVIPVLLLVLALPLCVTVLRQRMMIHGLQVAMRRFDAGEIGPARLMRTIDATDRCGASCPLEAQLLAAIAEADVAMKAQSVSERQSLLARANGSADSVAAIRPGWGDALATAASIAALPGGDSARAMQYFRRSYAVAPYLRAQSLWRLQFGSANWATLDEVTRQAVIREAAWLARIGPKDRAEAIAALGDTPAGTRFALRQLSLAEALAPPALAH